MEKHNDSLPLYPSVNTTPQIQSQYRPPMSGPQSSEVKPGPTEVMLLGPENTKTVCQFCKASIKTTVQYTANTRTHIAAALCGLVCCCCCIPYCSNSAKNADHYCPNCQRYLGTYHK